LPRLGAALPPQLTNVVAYTLIFILSLAPFAAPSSTVQWLWATFLSAGRIDESVGCIVPSGRCIADHHRP